MKTCIKQIFWEKTPKLRGLLCFSVNFMFVYRHETDRESKINTCTLKVNTE